MDKKKVLILPGTLRVGGAEKVARDIALYADTEKYRFHYLVFGEETGGFEPDVEAVNAKIIRMPEPSESHWAFFRELIRLMKQESYRVVHAHTMFNCGLVMLAGKLAGIPVRIAHSHSVLDDGAGFVKKCYQCLMRTLILAFATDCVACGKRAGIRLYGEKAFRKRGKLILNGIDTQRYGFCDEKRQQIRTVLGLENAFVLGHVGHLAEVKNQKFLLELMPQLLKKRPDAHLLLVGEGDDRPMLEEMIRRLCLEAHVTMTGNVSNVEDFLCAMDVFVFPSLYEGTPLSVLEVQANSLPCVISDRVPEDVFVTDLIHPLPLTDSQTCWIDKICEMKRNNRDYSGELKRAGFDVAGAMGKIYRIYEKG